MNGYRKFGWVACILSIALSGTAISAGSPTRGSIEKVIAQGPYKADWKSLTKHPVPKWFEDAKFGIYYHWGLYSVPAFQSEWYSTLMYREGSAVYKHHLAKYGHPSKFGYKDFIPLFRAEKFNPDEWAELFATAGARFSGPVCEHADGFAMWDSALTKWDAADMGPKKDIVGLLEKAIRKHNLKFIATFHHGWNWDWYPVWDKRYDCSNPKYAGLYGPPHAKGDKPTKEFNEEWKAKVIEVIDKYQPDMLWFDSKLKIIDDQVKREFLAYYYNKAAEWGKEVCVTYKNEDLPKGAGILDLERGRMSGLTKFKWLNDDAIDWKSWGYIENPRFKSANRLVDGLVDIVSKNGNLLLDFGPKPNGEIPNPVRERLLEVGRWLRLNGEAIYGTRPWKTFGEGPTEVKGGMFSEKEIREFTAEDIRFTTKGDMLFAIALAWPHDRWTIRSLRNGSDLLEKEIAGISLLGSHEKLEWKRTNNGLVIQAPSRKPCTYAFVFKIVFK